MCNIFSGHIVTDKSSKDWGKVLFVSGIHHEKDRLAPRVSKYEPHLLAWETKFPADFSTVKATHTCGQQLPAEDKNTLLDLVKQWGQSQKLSHLLNCIDNSDDAWHVLCDAKHLTRPERAPLLKLIDNSADAWRILISAAHLTRPERAPLLKLIDNSGDARR